jgi:hypothetical protein
VPGLDQASGAGREKWVSCGVGGLGRILVSRIEVMVSMRLLHTLRYALILSYRCHVTRNFHEIENFIHSIFYNPHRLIFCWMSTPLARNNV